MARPSPRPARPGRVIEAALVGLEAPVETPFAWGDGRADRRTSLVVRIESDDGTVGWGTATTGTGTFLRNHDLDGLAAALEAVLVDGDPRETGVLWHRLRSTGLPTRIVGAADDALWDLLGKIAGQPVTT